MIPPPSRRPFLLLWRVLARTVGPPALVRAVPPFVALGLASAVIFGGNGMRPADLARVERSSLGVRLALWGTFWLLGQPAARALFETPGSFFLRSLPVPAWHFHVRHAAHLLALQAPFMVLLGLGAGPWAALGSGVALGAFAAVGVVGLRRPLVALAGAGLLFALVAAAPFPALLGLGAVVGTLAIPAAYRLAPERQAGRGRATIGGSPAAALALAYLAVARRRDLVPIARGILAAATGGVVLALTARNNGLEVASRSGALALMTGALPLAIAVSGVASRVVETERRLQWLLLTTATSPAARTTAALGVTLAWGAAMGALFAAVALALGGPSGGPALVGQGAALGLALAAFAGWSVRRLEVSGRVDGSSVVVALLGASALTAILASLLGSVALVPLLAAGARLVQRTPRLIGERDRRGEATLTTPAADEP